MSNAHVTPELSRAEGVGWNDGFGVLREPTFEKGMK